MRDRRIAGLALPGVLVFALALMVPAVARGSGVAPGASPTPGHGPGGTPTPPQEVVSVTATPDRLAEPTLPANPSQADRGAQVYWFSCMACHGDEGQGLTTEFRNLYPPDHVDCWKSGCHGPHPYENGFTLPTKVPAVIGPGALDSFRTADDLHRFIHVAMPYQAPGSLADDVYWQVTAFLLRQNGITGGLEPIGPQDAGAIIVGRGAASPVAAASDTPTAAATSAAAANAASGSASISLLIGVVLGAILAVAAGFWVRGRRRTPGP